MPIVSEIKRIVRQMPEPIPGLARRLYRVLSVKRHAFAAVVDDSGAMLYVATPSTPVSDVQPGGHLRFISCTGVDGWKNLVPAACSQPGGVAIVGDAVEAERCDQILAISDPKRPRLRLTSFNAMFELRQRNDIRAVILLCRRDSFLRFLRGLVHALPFDGDVFVPAVRDVVWPVRFEDPRPIVQCAYPCAGTNRFTPSFLKLMELVKWDNAWFSPFMRNVHVLGAMSEAALRKPPSLAEANEAIFWRARSLDFNQVLTIHEWLGLSRFAVLDCRVVVLMRDPRDIVNSYFWHTRGETELEPEEHLLRIINGYCRFHFGEAAYAFNWPDAGELVQIYLTALESPNMYIIRFEDLHTDPNVALRALMQNLGVAPSPFVDLDEQAYSDAVYLGSFEYQTGGRRKRGEDHTGRPGGEHSGISARKGIVGDWRNSFTPKAVARFKELTGDALYRLGYETDPDWGVR